MADTSLYGLMRIEYHVRQIRLILGILSVLAPMGCSDVLLKVDDLREELTRASWRPPPDTLEVTQVSLAFSFDECRRALDSVLKNEDLLVASSEFDSTTCRVLTTAKPLDSTETTRALFTCERRGTYSVALRLLDAGPRCLLSVSATFFDGAGRQRSNCASTGQIENRLQDHVARALEAEVRRREEDIAHQETQRRQLREREAEQVARQASALVFAKTAREITTAGYPLKDTVLVFKGSLDLVDGTLQAQFFVCAGSDSSIKAILVELHNSNVPGGANLLAFAPMLLFQRLNPSVARSGLEESDYGVVNYLSRTVSEGTFAGQDWRVFAVQPGETKRMLFQYGPMFGADSGGIVPPYRRVCAMALKGVDDMYGIGSAQFRVGEDGKFIVKGLKRFRGKQIPSEPAILSPDPER